MSRVRDLLAQASPPVSMKAGWRAYLRAARRHGRATGWRAAHRDRAALERSLDRAVVLPPDAAAARAEALKVALRDLVHHDLDAAAAGRAAQAIDAALCALAPDTATEPVDVQVVGWPPGLGAEVRRAVTGLPGSGDRGRLAPDEAAALRHAVDGQPLGGGVLRVRVALPDGVVLPAVPREDRDRSRRTSDDGTAAAWLPHLDEEGRRCLSPRFLADAQAAMIAAPAVVDAFCGCGGDAVALALAGKRVLAVERDPGRAALARANAEALGVPVDVRCADAAEVLAGLGAEPGALAAALGPGPHALLLDPPWGGPGSGGRPTDWDALVPLAADLLSPFDEVLLKAPRAFDLASLPAGWRWSWQATLSEPGADGRCVVKALSCRGTRGLLRQDATGA